jgi:hypothetical protein
MAPSNGAIFLYDNRIHSVLPFRRAARSRPDRRRISLGICRLSFLTLGNIIVFWGWRGICRTYIAMAGRPWMRPE